MSDSAVAEGAGEFVDLGTDDSLRDDFASDVKPGGGVEEREAEVWDRGALANFRSTPGRD